MGPGLYTWMLFFTLARCRKNRDGAAFLILLPLVLLCAGLLLTPLNGETRYAYPIIASVPLYAVFCIRRAPENRS